MFYENNRERSAKPLPLKRPEHEEKADCETHEREEMNKNPARKLQSRHDPG